MVITLSFNLSKGGFSRVHFVKIRNKNKSIWPWRKGQGQIWHYQLIPQILFPIDVQYISYVYLAPIRCYRLPKYDGTVYDLDLRVVVKFDIAIGFLRCSFLWKFKTFHMCIWLQSGATGWYCCIQCISYVSYLTLIWPFRGICDLTKHVHFWVSITISTGNRLQTVITIILSNCLILQFLIFFSTLWPWEWCQDQIAYMAQRS